MESRAKLLGHPVHPMLIVFPLGLFATSVAFDIAYLSTDNARWADVAFWMISSGLIGGALAAIFGWIDFLKIPKETRARRIGLFHGGTNVVVMLVFAVSWLLRRDAPLDPEALAIGLSFAGLAFALVAGWLGGELVDRLAVGVDTGAHLNAPNALSRRPAHESVART